MQVLIYMLVAVVIIAVCILAMSVGLIFRNKTFTSCGRAAQDFDGESIRCAACGETVEADGKSCDRKKQVQAKKAAASDAP